MKNIKRKVQIGVIGSYSDLKYPGGLKRIAEEIGSLVAEAKAVLIVGGEKDGGLTRAAARGAKENGGLVVGIMPKKENACKFVDVVIQTGGMRGLREYLMSITCDVIIAINGGSGTLNEITVAYQNNIPVVMMDGTGGWAEKLANTFLDDRKRYRFQSAKTAEEAVKGALKLVKLKRARRN